MTSQERLGLFELRYKFDVVFEIKLWKALTGAETSKMIRVRTYSDMEFCSKLTNEFCER